MKSLFAIAALIFSGQACATSLSLDWLLVELPSGWESHVEQAMPAGSAFGNRVAVRRDDGAGVLLLQTYTAETSVDDEALRRLTNIPASEPLTKDRWGDFLGYRHDHVESDLFHRTWWLANGRNLVFVSYQCPAEQQHIESAQIEAIVRSLMLASSR